MSSTVHTLPDDLADWPHWLERTLLSQRLADLVVELEAIQGGPTTGETTTLEEICGDALAAVYAEGLAVLSGEQMRRLLKHPELLLALQEAVLLNGEDYWTRIPREADQTRDSETGWKSIAAACGICAEQNAPGPEVPTANAAVAVAEPATSSSNLANRRSGLRWVAAAAAVLLMALGWWFTRPTPPTWGFDRSALLTADVPREEYLNSLADAAEDWFKQRPLQPHEVIHRLREFEHGCDTLLAAPHPQLSASDRRWLLDKCELWKAKLVAHRAAMESGELSALQARDAADKTVRALQAALRSRITTA